jgi:nitrogen fixation protein FixH
MRVRPFFWYLLALSCMSVLILATSVHIQAPAIMQVRLEQQPPVASGLTTLELHLSDPQGLPIEQAQVIPSARMTNMEMVTNHKQVTSLGNGNYLAQLQLYMTGPWEISIEAHADGFESVQQTLLVQVQ